MMIGFVSRDLPEQAGGSRSVGEEVELHPEQLLGLLGSRAYPEVILARAPLVLIDAWMYPHNRAAA